MLGGKRILFVFGSYPGKRKFYERVCALGVRMSVLDGAGHWSLTASDLFEHAIVVDLAEPGTVLERALTAITAAGQRFDAVATFDEAAGPLTAGIAQHLGLPGHALPAIEAVRHKAVARQICRDAGIPTSRFALMRSADDLEVAVADVGFPAVLKPASGMASFAVYRVDSGAELWERYTQTQVAVAHAWEHELTSDSEAALIWAEGVVMVLEEFPGFRQSLAEWRHIGVLLQWAPVAGLGRGRAATTADVDALVRCPQVLWSQVLALCNISARYLDIHTEGSSSQVRDPQAAYARRASQCPGF